MEAPLHERVASDLRARIVSGALPVGAAVPSEAELCLQWGGSRGPVRQALAALRAEGLISGGRGKQPTVQRRELAQPFDSFVSFSRWARTLGLPPGQRTVEIARRRATPAVARHLDLEPGEPVVQLLRQRLLGGEPVMVERTTFVREWGSLLFEHDPDAGSIYEHLIGRGLRVGMARHTIDAVAADPDDENLLGVGAGAPLLREMRIAYTADGSPFEYSDDRYRPDRVTFTIDNAPSGQPLFGRTWHATARARPERDPVMIELAVFDVAGTTIEEGGTVYRVLTETVRAAGGDPSAAEIEAWMGASKREAIQALLTDPGDALVDAAFADFRSRLHQAYRDQPPAPFAGVTEVIARLRAAGVKVALSTGFDRETTSSLIASVGWDAGVLDAVICIDDVTVGRPAPFMIFHAMEATGVTDVRRVLVAGDTVRDVEAGRNAGAGIVVAVRTGEVTAETLAAAGPTYVLGGVVDLPEVPGLLA